MIRVRGETRAAYEDAIHFCSTGFDSPQHWREPGLDLPTTCCLLTFCSPCLAVCMCHVCDLSGNSLRSGTLACGR